MSLKEMKKFVMLICAILAFITGHAQTQVVKPAIPVAGQPIPEFRLTDVHYFTKKYFDSREMRGKWMILDFWGSGCTSCVRAFPKVNQLQKEFQAAIQFLLIGRNDTTYNKNIKQNFARYTQKLGLTLSIAYDTTLFENFNVTTVPHVVIVDPLGVVYAISTTEVLTHKNLQDLIDGKKPILPQKSDRPAPWRYLSDDNNGRDNFNFQTILSSYHGEEVEWGELIDKNASQGFFRMTSITLSELFKFAWFGKSWWVSWDPFYATHSQYPVWEIADSARFTYNDTKVSEKFNFHMAVPRHRANREGMMKTMQAALQNYFNYTAFVETRSMPYWKLTATVGAKKKLISRYSKSQEDAELEAGGLKGRHISIGLIIGHIQRYTTDRLPIFDETGIKEPIDIDLAAAMIDIGDVQNALKKHGLVLEKSQRKMQVLVIRDLPAYPLP